MSKFTIEGFAPGPCAAHAGSFLQKKSSAHTIEGGLSQEERVAPALAFDCPLSNSAEIPTDAQQPVKFVPGSSAEGARLFWTEAPRKLREGCRTGGGASRRTPGDRPPNVGLLLPKSIFRFSGRRCSIWEWAARGGLTSSQLVSPLSAQYQKRACTPRWAAPPPMSRSELLDGAPERLKVRLSSRTSPYDSRLRKEALSQRQ